MALALLILSLATRAVALGSFSWPDELTWLERSAAFVTALEQGDLAGTYLADHPGVVPMWGFGGALYLRARLVGDRTALEALAAEAYEEDVPSQLATAALFTVGFTSLAVAVAYGLLIPLLGRAGALLAGLLLALDPFLLVHSRIVHVDAILSSLMLLAGLALLVYLKHPDRRRYLVLSGAMGGLAILTKTPALFLMPLVALALGGQGLLRRMGRATWGRPVQLVGAFVLWLAVAWGLFLLLWPATWQDPLFFLWRLYRASRWGVVVSHGSNYFLGQVVGDPGPLFYLVVLPFRLSPLVLLLLPISLVQAGVAWKYKQDVRTPLLGLAFLVFFLVMVSLAAKKGDRYLLPVYPWADIVAAWGCVMLCNRRRRQVRRALLGVGAALVLLSSILWLRLAPHYGAYFNPLVGGGPVAARTYAFGQGEGLELAAQYLNNKEGSRDLLVVTFYPPQFRYYFHGSATSLRRGEWDQTWRFADYVVFYVSQVQRKLPTPALVDFFLAQEPEHVVRLGGVAFARIYRSPLLLSGQPPTVQENLDGRLGEGLGLVGFALDADRFSPGEEVYATLDWQALIQLGVDYELDVRLVDGAGRTVWDQAGPPFDGFFPTSWWRPGRTMHTRYEIPLPEHLPPGQYHLLAGARDPGSGNALSPAGRVHGQWPDHLMVVTITVSNAP
jgi:4-amino-4-deoxy-L-arabinose transferase-like glycosyltransferase